MKCPGCVHFFLVLEDLKSTKIFLILINFQLIQTLKKNNFGEVINVGNKFEISIKDILNIIQKDFCYDFKVVIDEKRVRSNKSEVFRLLASDSKAKKLLNWKPKYKGIDGFKRGLKKTIEWFNNPDNIRLYKADIYNI